jgi:SSS family solute:Na+ symporter
VSIGGIDLFIVVAYLIAIPIFGVYFRKYVKTEECYFLSGKMLPWWVISMSIIGTIIGAYDYMGAASGAYRFGIAQANYEWIAPFASSKPCSGARSSRACSACFSGPPD